MQQYKYDNGYGAIVDNDTLQVIFYNQNFLNTDLKDVITVVETVLQVKESDIDTLLKAIKNIEVE